MRRSFILALLVSLLVVAGGTKASPAVAAEGDPGDYCSHSPDYPFGWSFNEACRGHDTCIADLPVTASLLERLGCDDSFLADLLDAQHRSLDAVCEDSAICSLLAGLYHRVVRTVTMLSWGAVDPSATRAPG